MGKRVKLDLSKVQEYALFPGQVKPYYNSCLSKMAAQLMAFKGCRNQGSKQHWQAIDRRRNSIAAITSIHCTETRGLV